MWLMLQQEEADDFVIATGETRSIRDFAEAAFGAVDVKIEWQGSGENEIGVDVASGKTVLKVNPRFYRPAEVELLLGDPSKAESKLGWKREVSFDQMVERMVKNDLELVKGE
jgi:GDPmannose 4,6-dehydratase